MSRQLTPTKQKTITRCPPMIRIDKLQNALDFSYHVIDTQAIEIRDLKHDLAYTRLLLTAAQQSSVIDLTHDDIDSDWDQEELLNSD